MGQCDGASGHRRDGAHDGKLGEHSATDGHGGARAARGRRGAGNGGRGSAGPGRGDSRARGGPCAASSQACASEACASEACASEACASEACASEACASGGRGERPRNVGGRARVGAVREHARGEACGGKDGQDGRERLALGGDQMVEVAAAGAHREMSTQRTAAQFATAGDGELFADLAAGGRARVAVGDQSGARLVDERLDLAHGTPHDRGDRLVGKVVELGQQERAALLLGQAADVAHELAQVLALADLLGEACQRRRVILERGSRPAGGDRRQAAVAGDRVQPRAQLARGGPAEQSPVGPDEGLLKGVLGLVLVAEHVPAVGEQRGMVTPEDCLECGLVAGTRALGERGVREVGLLVGASGDSP